jgi:hypothetical protein
MDKTKNMFWCQKQAETSLVQSIKLDFQCRQLQKQGDFVRNKKGTWYLFTGMQDSRNKMPMNQYEVDWLACSSKHKNIRILRKIRDSSFLWKGISCKKSHYELWYQQAILDGFLLQTDNSMPIIVDRPVNLCRCDRSRALSAKMLCWSSETAKSNHWMIKLMPKKHHSAYDLARKCERMRTCTVSKTSRCYERCIACQIQRMPRIIFRPGTLVLLENNLLS